MITPTFASYLGQRALLNKNMISVEIIFRYLQHIRVVCEGLDVPRHIVRRGVHELAQV